MPRSAGPSGADDIYAQLARSPRLSAEDTAIVLDAALSGSEMPAGFWVTQDRRIHKIADMADAHLLNTIRVFEGRGQRVLKDVPAYPEERRSRKYDELIDEAHRRGLALLDSPHPTAVDREMQQRRDREQQ